jgi:cellulose synthase operon protein C
MRALFPCRISFGRFLIPALLCGTALVSAPYSRAEVPPDQAAELLLNSAQKAFNEQNYPFAAAKFQEFVQKFSGHPQVNAARYGLGLSYIDGPERNFEKAIEPLSALAGNPGFAEHPYAVYYLGLAYRGAALNDLVLAATKQGDEQKQIRGRAEGRMQEALKQFAGALTELSAKLPKGEIPKELPKEFDWAARARCDKAEMELRLNKLKEAIATAEPFSKDPLLMKSRYRTLGLYYHGFAAFLSQDYLVAGRTLNQLAPFNDPINGLHARYLMGRVYQISEEPDKAATMYDGVLADFDKQKKEAAEALKQPDRFKNNPTERARLESLVRNPPPDHVSGSVFFSACLLYEGGKFAEALSRFQTFAKDFPRSPLAPEASLRVGFCQVNLKQYGDAEKTLAPLVDKNPRLADQILFWLGKAQAGAALTGDPMNAPARENGLRTALATLKNAAERAGQLAANDPDARIRRAQILLETADTQQHAKLYKEAAALYEQVRNEKLLQPRDEEIAQRAIAAQHLAGDYVRSDQLCAAFQKDFPRSALLPVVLFRYAENAYFAALASEKRPDFPNKAVELPKLYDEAGKRYQAVIERYPEFERIAIARYGLAVCHFKQNQFEEAEKVLEAIPAADRTGDLINVPYLLAECLIRLAPTVADDALQIGMLQERLQQAQQNLEAYLAVSPKSPEAPDAMLKLGVCQERLAMLNAQPQERNNALAVARKTFENLANTFPKQPQGIQAVMERAKCIAFAGDKGGAVNELRRFTNDPLQQSNVAPTAVIYLATLLREQNKAEEAAAVLNNARQRHEPSLLKDQPERAALLRYHQGVCLLEANKPGEARSLLDTIAPMAAGKPLAVEAALRSGQARIAEATKIIEEGKKQLAAPNLNPQQRDAGNNTVRIGFNILKETAEHLQARAEEFREKQPTLEARARMFYEAAWAWRTIADRDVSSARSAMQREMQKQLQAAADKKAAPGIKAAQVPLPDVARAAVPLQPTETKAREAYRILIDSFADTLLSIEARFELAEMMAERDEHDAAIKLFKEALDKEPSDNKQPSPELLDRVRLRLGDCLAAKKEYREALEKLTVVADNPKSPLKAQGQYRAALCQLELGELDKAVARLALFRDKPEFQNVAGVSDHALLRLGQSLGQLKQWDPSRQALTLLTQRYGNSPWLNEARFGIGWASQNLGQFDPAVEAFKAVTTNTATELAAKAHLQIGLCRLEQKRYGEAATALLVVPYTFDYPELSAAALTEAARALVGDKKPDQAEIQLRKVIKDYPNSEWAKVAQKRLDEMMKK